MSYMKQTRLWMLAAILVICGATVLTSCSSVDNPADNPTVEEPTLPEARVTETIRYDEARMTAYNIEYPSTDPYGQPATLSGTITVGDEVTKGEPARGLLLYNHYTVNRADECPSRGDIPSRASMSVWRTSARYRAWPLPTSLVPCSFLSMLLSRPAKTSASSRGSRPTSIHFRIFCRTNIMIVQ